MLNIRSIKLSDIKPGALLSPGSSVNSMRYKGTNLKINFYELITEFYHDGLWSYYPQTNAPRELLEAFETATDERSINGFGAVLGSGDKYHSIDTRYLWVLQDDEQMHIGWVVGIPYSSGNDPMIGRVNQPSFNAIGTVADRIKIIVWETGAPLGVEYDYEYTGATLGNLLNSNGLPVNIAVFGNGKNDYDRCVWLIEELTNRFEKNKVVLDRHSNPHLMGPESAAPRETTDSEGEKVRQGFEYKEDGMFLPLDEEGKAKYDYLVWDPKIDLTQLQTDRIVDMLHIITGIPATAFGLPNAANKASGTSLERQMFKALSKIKRLRREIEGGLEAFGQFNYKWVDDPFITARERTEYVRELYKEGIITTQEARELSFIGLAGMPQELRRIQETSENTQNSSDENSE